MVRTLTLIAVSIVISVVAMWFAESSVAPVILLSVVSGRASWWLVMLAVVLLVSCAALGVLLLRPYGWPARFGGALAILVAVWIGLIAGDRSQMRAYNECVEDARLLQASIESFRQRNGQYPNSLLEVGTVPCRRVLRGTIVSYERTASGYNVSFGDWLVQWRGSERQPVTATK